MAGRSDNSAEWRNTISNESTFDRYASTKRTIRKEERLDTDESFFREESDKDRYLITYADLITLLLGLFIILYTMSSIDTGKYKGVVAALGSIFGSDSKIAVTGTDQIIPTPKDKLAEDLNKLITMYNYNNSIRLEQNERGVTIHILEDILFPPGKATLSENSKLVLSRLAKILRNLPNDIRVEGHTDNVPINTPQYPSNWHLSVDRALSTAYYLIKYENLSPDKVSIVGYSEYRPIASNDLPETRALNRRVDIVILK
ncbi:OmpA/MotB family protein [Rosettibacter firmus]|uniref:OmpA/MotB family protein n=1 Tax=Rosettibacter firmus TaxID=3111522 RepID=UPI00336C228B